MNQEREIEIDIRSILLRLISQWKMILLVSLLMAMIVCGIKHNRDVSEYNAKAQTISNAASQAAQSLDEKVDAVLETLPPDERSDAALVVSEKEWLAYQRKYLSESVLMQTDPSNQRIMRAVYDIDCANAADAPVLMHKYVIYLYSDEVISGIKAYINPDADNNYIGELFNNVDGADSAHTAAAESAALDVNIVLPEDTDLGAVLNVISTALSEYSSMLQSDYPHTIALAGVEDTHTYSTDNVEKRKDLFSNIYNTENLLKVKEANLTDGQTLAVETIMSLKSGSTAEEIAGSSVAPGFSKKYAVMGFAIGLVIYVFMYIAWIILRGRFTSAPEVERYTQKRVLGEIYCRKEGLGRFVGSNIVLKLQRGDKLDKTAQINKLKKSLTAICEHKGIKKAALIRTSEAQNICNLADEIASAVNESSIQMQVIDYAGSGFEEESLLQIQEAVVIVENGAKESAISQLMNICREYGINILGSVFIEA